MSAMVRVGSLMSCKKCQYQTRQLKCYVTHYKMHSNIPNLIFPCGVVGCPKVFRTHGALNMHVSRVHSQLRNCAVSSHVQPSPGVRSLQCTVLHCNAYCENTKKLILHLKEHVRSHTVIDCPFKDCKKRFDNVTETTFKSHVSRCQRKSMGLLKADLYNTVVEETQNTLVNASDYNKDCVPSDLINYNVSSDAEDTELADSNVMLTSTETSSLLLKDIALFALKLRVKHHISESVVQMIIEEYRKLTNDNLYAVENKIKTLIGTDVSADVVQGMLQCLHRHPLSSALDLNQGPLRSKHAREAFYKQSFHFVEPVQMMLRNKCCFHYVPILSSLQAMFRDENIASYLHDFKPGSCGSDRPTVLIDIADGDVCRQDKFFVDDPNALKIILYQDEFEVVNPLGSAKGKHKLFAVYYTIGNLHASTRSKIDGLQLVLLCNHTALASGALYDVFKPLTDDLMKLYAEGINLGPNFGVRKGKVVFVLGDNLGSHMVGGFVESFSGTYFCRYCLATKDCLATGDCSPSNFQQRTMQSYDDAVLFLEQQNGDNYLGIKRNSPLHSFPDFHVCKPSLPPCIGHDFFEGIVPADLTLCLRYFVVEKKWFTFQFINKQIQQLKLKGYDARDRPAVVNVSSGKVSGHAVQVWVLVRFLPLLIGERIVETDDNVWRLVLLLRDVVANVCAPRADMRRVSIMNDQIEEYIELRMSCFPMSKLKPKHHYISHYPALTLSFGPLIRLWTLRFESKHSYFKKAIRSGQNFMNITKTCAYKHQLLQAYYTAGSLFGPAVNLLRSMPFNLDAYNSSIIDSVDRFDCLANSDETEVATSVTVDNILYEKGLYVVLKENDDELNVGLVHLILVHKNTNAYLVVEQKHTAYDYSMGVHVLIDSEQSLPMLCLPLTELQDSLPLQSYNMAFSNILVLHHAV